MNGKDKNSLVFDSKDCDNIVISLAFQGHYFENDLKINLSRKFIKGMGGCLRFEMIGNPYDLDQNGCRITFWEEVRPFKEMIKLSDKISYKQSSLKPKKEIQVAVPLKSKPIEEEQKEGTSELKNKSK